MHNHILKTFYLFIALTLIFTTPSSFANEHVVIDSPSAHQPVVSIEEVLIDESHDEVRRDVVSDEFLSDEGPLTPSDEIPEENSVQPSEEEVVHANDLVDLIEVDEAEESQNTRADRNNLVELNALADGFPTQVRGGVGSNPSRSGVIIINDTVFEVEPARMGGGIVVTDPNTGDIFQSRPDGKIEINGVIYNVVDLNIITPPSRPATGARPPAQAPTPTPKPSPKPAEPTYDPCGPGGGRNGLECPEERDYYPYMRATPFRDVAYITGDIASADRYRRNPYNPRRGSNDAEGAGELP